MMTQQKKKDAMMVYTLFGCSELGQEIGILEFGLEFQCLEGCVN
jgi:hypothetical protein